MESHDFPLPVGLCSNPRRQADLKGDVLGTWIRETRALPELGGPMIPAQGRWLPPSPIPETQQGLCAQNPPTRAERGSGFWAEVRKELGELRTQVMRSGQPKPHLREVAEIVWRVRQGSKPLGRASLSHGTSLQPRISKGPSLGGPGVKTAHHCKG